MKCDTVCGTQPTSLTLKNLLVESTWETHYCFCFLPWENINACQQTKQKQNPHRIDL